MIDTFACRGLLYDAMLANGDGSPIRSDIKSSDTIKLKLFTWGEIARPLKSDLTYSEFQKYHFQAIVVGK